MKISIVTISFNQETFLRECIDSVLKQNIPELEYIVVDPGSTDGSREIIESYGDQIIRIFEPDKGPADGLNKGFQMATGDVFGFLNSDDVLLPGALEFVLGFFRHSSADLVCGGGSFIDEHGKHITHIAPSKMTPWLYSYGAVTLFQQGTFFRRGIFKAVDGFNEKNLTCWDGELFLDMSLKNARFEVVRDRLACFRLHGQSITVSRRYKDKLEMDRRRLFEKAMGRPWSVLDTLFRRVVLPAKYVIDPTYLLRRGLGRRMSFD